jgi:mevalonate kinase
MKQVFDQNELQVKRIAMALKDGDNLALISAIREGQRTLEQMGVVSPQAKRIIRHLESVGAGAKILGGGGRRSGVGYILCYHADPEVLSSQANTLQRNLIPIQLGEEGIRLETKE